MKKTSLCSAIIAPVISLLSFSQVSYADDLYGAELYSLDSVLYGKFVFRMKMVSEPGVVSSFFTYDNLSWQGDDYPWREIDFEAIGIESDLLQTNLITGDLYDKETSEETAEVENLSQYHIFTLEWTPDSVVWKVDGVAVRTELAEDSEQVTDLQGTPQTYRSNLWISESEEWVGEIDVSQLPLYQVIDWMEYYSYVDEDEFEFEWRDDFTWFDTSRWAAGDWTFDTNMVTFDPSNLAVINGELVFALTSGEPGIDVSDYQGE
jgi:beta-glucanase (GH16 family)